MSATGSTFRTIQKLFVGNLPWTIGNNELKLYFSKFGHVSNVHIIFDKTNGISKGYGFVTFSTREGYNAVFNKQNHLLEGKILTIETASS